MRTVKQLTSNKFLNIKEIKDPSKHIKGFQFAERRGVDSVAFICFDPGRKEFLLNREQKPPIDRYVWGAFGGSFDKDKSPEDIVIDEVKEEAGFTVTKKDVKFVGKVLVSTQMNQYCYLYIVMVNKNKQGERKPENLIEASATTSWFLWSNDIYRLEDWKPITIITKAQAQGII